MIWLIFGVLSIFWDPGMGYIFPLLSLYILGYFWNRTHPIAMFIILLLHHIASLNSGFMELSLMIAIFLITEIDSLFIKKVIPYVILSVFIAAVMYFSYGITAGITTIVASFIVYLWRG